MSYYLLILVRIVDPRFNEPLYNEALGITNVSKIQLVVYYQCINAAF